MTDSNGRDDDCTEKTLRDILEPLDRQLAWFNLLFPLALVTIVPACFFALWLGLELTGKRALAMAGGVCCIMVAIHLCWELLAARLALSRFNAHFPPGSAERSRALEILNELVTPSKADEKLRNVLASYSPDRIIRHHREEIQQTPLPDQDLSPRPHIRIGAGNSTRKGYYDYIPLEPRAPESGQQDSSTR